MSWRVQVAGRYSYHGRYQLMWSLQILWCKLGLQTSTETIFLYAGLYILHHFSVDAFLIFSVDGKKSTKRPCIPIFDVIWIHVDNLSTLLGIEMDSLHIRELCGTSVVALLLMEKCWTNSRGVGDLMPWRHVTSFWYLNYTETKMVWLWWNFHHWQRHKLSKWQLPVQLLTKISSKWRHPRANVLQKTFLCSAYVLLMYCSCGI